MTKPQIRIASSPLRAAITAAYRRREQDCVRDLIETARLDADMRARAEALALELIVAARARPATAFSVNALMQEFSLSSEEGIALMCLAEALLRIPDQATADALIRDKLAHGDWREHVGNSTSLFVNAAAWGLMITGQLVSSYSENSLGAALLRIAATGGRPLIRKSVDLAMQLLGRHFVAGRDIAEAIANNREAEQRGYRHSYDMLGEAALTEDDATRYFRAYEQAIHAIGRGSTQMDHVGGPGISIKLSALHPRFTHLQGQRVMAELYPRVHRLALLARDYRIGLTIDAEEADRVELTLDLFETLALDLELARFAGLGLVVQAYGKRAPFIVDWLRDLAQRRGTALMVRLVKGAYWDSEIKRAQVDGLADFPVFTRKVYTDVSYIACARRLLDAGPWLYPQFATHNALTVATIVALAQAAGIRDYEFQCLHGMGELLYDQALSPDRAVQACRIYAPVGSHETLLPYLVRRLLENGANSSFVNRLADERVAPADLVADPVDAAERLAGAPQPAIAPPARLFAGTGAGGAASGQEFRPNSMGFDISSEVELRAWRDAWQHYAQVRWEARPLFGTAQPAASGEGTGVFNPADRAERVGTVTEAGAETAGIALSVAADALPAWSARSAQARAAILCQAADLIETHRFEFFALAIREAGKTLPNAIAEVREAVDFLRYYAVECQRYGQAEPVGITACISPWNFPLAIFLGQIGAALAAGNVVIAKPAEQTPLIGARAVELLYEAGVPPSVLQFLPGRGEVMGAALVADPRVAAVAFTGSTQVARLIARTQQALWRGDGRQRVLIAETGGQNAMVVDSSALPEQVVNDAVASAFDSAGQRCSALRVLCVQAEVAERIVDLLKGAMDQLAVGNPARLASDIGPVIDRDAMRAIEGHVDRLRAAGCAIHRCALPPECATGTYVAPTLIEISSLDLLQGEIFGPVLHVLRVPRVELATLADTINAMGYGLTFGIHSRIDESIRAWSAQVRAGNLYVNRNMIGAVVGVQPFGGCGLSGTGPKAGGPLYLPRFLRNTAPRLAHLDIRHAVPDSPVFRAFAGWARQSGFAAGTEQQGPCGTRIVLPGPTGERNTLSFRPRGCVLVEADTLAGVIRCLALALASAHGIVLGRRAAELLGNLSVPLPVEVSAVLSAPGETVPHEAILHDGELGELLSRDAFGPNGEILPLLQATDALTPWRLPIEQCVSVNTTASGGNTALLSLCD